MARGLIMGNYLIFSFGTSSRFKIKGKKKKSFEPGPGIYDIPPTVPDVPKYLLPRKRVVS